MVAIQEKRVMIIETCCGSIRDRKHERRRPKLTDVGEITELESYILNCMSLKWLFYQVENKDV